MKQVLIHYCKILLQGFHKGESMHALCEKPGMPSMGEVRKWLFNKDYHQDYKGFREGFTYLLTRSYNLRIDQLNELSDKHNKAVDNYTWDSRKILEQYKILHTAVLWMKKTIELLDKLYKAHEQGKDFLIDGEHYCKIIQTPIEPIALGEEEQKLRDEKREARREERERKLAEAEKSGEEKPVNMRPFMSGELLRYQAEILLGVPLLYGRYRRRARKKARERKSSMVRAHIQEKHSVPQSPLEKQVQKYIKQAEKLVSQTNAAVKKTIPTNHTSVPPQQRILRDNLLGEIQNSRDGASTSSTGSDTLSATGIQSKNISDIPNPTSDIHLNRFQRREIGKASPRTGGSNYTKPKKKRKRK